MLFLPSIWVTWLLVSVGIAVLLWIVRLLWGFLRRRSDSRLRLDHVSVRMREVFNEVSPRRRFWGSPFIDFKHQGRPARLTIHSIRKLTLEVEDRPEVPLPVVVRTRPWMSVWPVTWRLEALDRVVTSDPVVDDQVELRANGLFAAFLQDRLFEQVPIEGPPTGLAESLLVLNAAPGVRRFDLRFLPGRRDTLKLKLRTEDLLFRPEDLESLLHHVHNLHESFAHYDRPALPPAPHEPAAKPDPKKTTPPAPPTI